MVNIQFYGSFNTLILLLLLPRLSLWTLRTFLNFFDFENLFNFFSNFNFWNFIFDFLLQWSFNTMGHSIHSYYCCCCCCLGDPSGHVKNVWTFFDFESFSNFNFLISFWIFFFNDHSILWVIQCCTYGIAHIRRGTYGRKVPISMSLLSLLKFLTIFEIYFKRRRFNRQTRFFDE